jgi:MFS family permease
MPKRPPLTIRAALGTLREVASNAPLISMVILGGLGSLFIGTALAPLMPEYARLLGAERAGPAYGALLAAGAAGAVVGGIALEATGILKSTVRSAIWCTVVYGLAMAAFAISRDYALSLTLLFIGGIANLASSSMSQAMVQLLAPPDMRGRIIGVYHMSASGLRAGSGLTIGVLGGFIGVHASLAMSAAALCLSSILLLAYLRRTPSAT